MKVLAFLAEHKNRAFACETLRTRVWTANPDVSQDLVRVYISRLRKKLEQAGAGNFLKTVDDGYMLSE